MSASPDGTTVTSPDRGFTFAGYDRTASEIVEVMEWQPGGLWRTAGSTWSARVSEVVSGERVYPWSMTIGLHGWYPGTTGRYARARVRRAGRDWVPTFGAMPRDCAAMHPTNDDFLAHCQAPHSPDVLVYDDAFPASVDLSISFIRGRDRRKVDVGIKNTGRPGIIDSIACSAKSRGAGSLEDLQRLILPGEELSFPLTILVTPDDTVTCLVRGHDEDGPQVPRCEGCRAKAEWQLNCTANFELCAD